jgi:hypothetical protein
MSALDFKISHFEKVFPFPIENNEWNVKWPVVGLRHKSYNPDYFCGDLNCYIELVTSYTRYSAARPQWRQCIIAGRPLRVFWWTGVEITEQVRMDLPPSAVSELVEPRVDLSEAPTVDEVIRAAKAYYCERPENACGGSLHVVLDDGNTDHASVEFCRRSAIDHADNSGALLANLLGYLTEGQRQEVFEGLHS